MTNLKETGGRHGFQTCPVTVRWNMLPALLWTACWKHIQFFYVSSWTAGCTPGSCLLGHSLLGLKIFVSAWIPDDWPLGLNPGFDLHSCGVCTDWRGCAPALLNESLHFSFPPASRWLCQHATWVFLYFSLLWALDTWCPSRIRWGLFLPLVSQVPIPHDMEIGLATDNDTVPLDSGQQFHPVHLVFPFYRFLNLSQSLN